jgi:sugar-specific transcriptional regulator TrmB
MTAEDILIQAGLSTEQAHVYQALLERGPMKAGDLSKWTGVKRGLVYKVLEQLELLGLIQKKGGSGTVTTYSPSHPGRLVDMLESQEKNIQISKETVTSNMGLLLSEFNLNQDKPNVQFFEGIKGLERLWADIISEKTDILLFQSPNDRHHPQVGEKIIKQINKQVANNIHTRAITPIVEDTFEWVEHMDVANLVSRQVIPLEQFNIPAQIILYGTDKVAVTSFGDTIITTITEDTVTYHAFEIIFNFIWNIAQEKYPIKKTHSNE